MSEEINPKHQPPGKEPVPTFPVSPPEIIPTPQQEPSLPRQPEITPSHVPEKGSPIEPEFIPPHE